MLEIGTIKLDVPFVQAALSGYSDLAMRRLARRFGAPYALNEVVLDRLVLQNGRKTRRKLAVPDDDHPVGGQLMGSNPDDFAPAAVMLAEAGYDVIDINFGCPVKKVLGRCRGGFLLSQPATALEIVRRVYDAVGSTCPVTVKMRRGMDAGADSEHNFFQILDGAFEIGASAITVHGRTVEQRYVGPSRWAFLKRVKQRAGSHTILGSGDLFTAEDCRRMINETGVDGVTIARGCIGNPWIFRDCRALWSGQDPPAGPTIGEQRDAIAAHFADARAVHGDRLAPRIMRKFGVKYSELHPYPRAVRDAFLAVKTADDFHAVLDQWYTREHTWEHAQLPTPGRDLIAAGATR